MRTDEARTMIMNECRSLLAEAGYDSFNLRDLARACHIGIGTFYSHFESKDELILAIIGEDWQTMLNNIDNAMRMELTFKGRFAKAYEQVTKFRESYVDTFQMVPTAQIARINRESGNDRHLIGVFERLLATARQAGRITLKPNEIPMMAKLLVHFLYSSAFVSSLDFDTCYYFISGWLFGSYKGFETEGPVGVQEFGLT